MPVVNFVQPSGETQTIDIRVGSSVMAAAKAQKVPGIIADCNGECACSTCHVYVDDGWFDKLDGVSESEEMMFTFLDEIQDTSRLSCQIKMTEALDGLTVHVPVSQG